MGSSSTKWFWGIFLSLVFIGLMFVGISFLFFASVIKNVSTSEYYSAGSGEKIGLILPAEGSQRHRKFTRK